MKALRFDRFGGPDALRIETLPMPRAAAAHAVIKVQAASINPSDVGNVSGRFPHTTLPRTPGRDYAGVVVEGPHEWIGVEVWGTGDGGFQRDGSHAEYLCVPIASLRRKPSTLTPEQAASIGVTFSAAWVGVVEYAKLLGGETMVVVGAAGGVGGAAIQIGSVLGSRVIGIDVIHPAPSSPAAQMAEQILTPSPDKALEVILELTGGHGVDVILNAVGGPTFEPSLGMLAQRGRLCVLASPGQRRLSFDLLDFYHNESQLFGVDTLKRGMVASAEILEALTPGFESRAYRPPVIDEVISWDQAVDGYRRVAEGAAGRIVFRPGDAG